MYRFADPESLARWESSEERAAWLRKADDLVEETAVSRVSGLETWFALPGRTAPAPARWKMFARHSRGHRSVGAADEPHRAAAAR